MGFLFLLVSLFFLGASVYFIHHEHNRSKYGYHTQGTIIKQEEKWEYKNGSAYYMYYPIVQFRSEDSQVVQQKMEMGSSIPFYSVKEVIDIVYYQGKVYPTGSGWKILYWGFLLLSLGATIYQIYYW
ncbi:DUF3592 domain-containing protein [Rufibacter hautae]|uniref:DUF3592 domain-containing protein n=1 Tax=Rufibacter hautae TaxID=2595005 RepID=A0A5B6TUK0_9BACT|nr:DUF3592 domain-containing protein [Rufibacter hautae]KAA3440228.1 DUF3592 domain-containing protein [Rufibacter hautae]